MKSSIITLSDNTSIHKLEWLVSEAKAHLLLVHGYAEHAGRYNGLATFLNGKNISVTSYDQRGYGKSEGTRAYIDKFERYVSDLLEIRKQIARPVFLMGHSMGGLVSVQYMINKKDDTIKGLISSSAALELDPSMSPILQMLAPILGFLLPKLPTEKLDKTYLTRDPKVLKDYMNDPLNYLGGTRARTGAETLKAMKINRAYFSKVDIPLLALHGGGDELTMPGGTKKLHADASSSDKTLKIYPELYHELVHEPEKEIVMNDIANWILERA